jgi:CHAT domain-containing protein
VATDLPLADAERCARLGTEALRRYFQAFAEGHAGSADFDAADRYLGAALCALRPADPRHAELSFQPGMLRIAGHETRCGNPCPAPGEVRPATDLLAAAATRPGASVDRLYPYAMTVDKLYDHTGDPADIESALYWLGRAAQRRGLAAGDRRRALISVAIQHANRGASLRRTQDRAGPGSESWAAFAAAIGQFEALLAELPGRGRRSDQARAADRLDALLGLLETYSQRGGEQLSSTDLETMAGLGRDLCAAMIPGYRLRAYALGRCGSVLSRAVDAPGGLVVLAACSSAHTLADYDEALTLTSGFLAAGASGVIGSRWPVSDVRTALLMFMLHRHLARHPRGSPADALRAAQLWMTDPSRQPPGDMPALLADEVTRQETPDPGAWAAFTYYGS